ncbi:MAG: glycine dehydrogenase (aminomethyl-transferring), partial [Pseudomonadales bacterium]|nr:glycine dehydrogenase (aminomethyl-transferring) [Pseudomonadales bacterium]
METENQISALANSQSDSLESLQYAGEFVDRHIGPDDQQIQEMLETLGLESLERLVEKTVPESIALKKPLAMAGAVNESEALAQLKALADKNKATRSYIGLGYYDTITPNVIVRNVLENPGWYTAYTPYQPEISQGRLECLLNFQQMVLDLTAMELANASLLDEATAAAEAMALAKRVSKNRGANKFYVDANCFPQTIDVIKTRAECFGFDLVIGEFDQVNKDELFGAIFQYPSMLGDANDLSHNIDQLHAAKAIAIVAADLMSLAILKPPGEMGADVVLGSTQRFGVPMGYGGPHAAYFATRDDYKRAVPGRIIGVSVDSRNKQAYRMALQTREQHIRREKANSNICTAQVLLANISAMYAMYHGPDGIRRIANRIHRLTHILAAGLQQQGITVVNDNFFDTITLAVGEDQAMEIAQRAAEAGVNLRMDRVVTHHTISLSLDECTDEQQVETLWQVILGDSASALDVSKLDNAIIQGDLKSVVPDGLLRESAYLSHPIFNRYHSETEMMRYLKRLENKDISLTHAMIALG